MFEHSLKQYIQTFDLYNDFYSFEDQFHYIKINQFQTYTGFQQTITPRNYCLHSMGPASNFISGSNRRHHLNILENDFELWDNIIEQFTMQNIPTTFKFTFEITFSKHRWENLKFSDIITIDKFFEIEHILHYFYTFCWCIPDTYDTNKETLDHQILVTNEQYGPISVILVEHLYEVPDYDAHLKKTIASIYYMMLCPIIEDYQHITTKLLPVTNIATYTAVNFAEHLIIYIFDGTYQSQENLLKNQFGLHHQESLHVKGLIQSNKNCYNLNPSYSTTKNITNILQHVYFTHILGQQYSPLNSQQFFLLRKLHQIGKKIPYWNNKIIIALYLESCLVAIKNQYDPPIPNVNSPPHNYMTSKNFVNAYQHLPTSHISAYKISEFLTADTFYPLLKLLQNFT